MMNLVDACAPLRRFQQMVTAPSDPTPRLRWRETWKTAAGRDTVVGLLDTGCNIHLADLVGADLTVRDFTHAHQSSTHMEHGTFSVATLVGQGHRSMCGIAPCIRLLVAAVVEPDGIANPDVVATALAWLIDAGAHVIAIPLGDDDEHEEIIYQLERGAANGVTFFAAAGNTYPQPILFPARHASVIAVGAVTDRGTLLPTGNRLPQLDLLAPGDQVVSLTNEGVIRNRSGSSVACVIAAGVAALALSAEQACDYRRSPLVCKRLDTHETALLPVPL